MSTVYTSTTAAARARLDDARNATNNQNTTRKSLLINQEEARVDDFDKGSSVAALQMKRFKADRELKEELASWDRELVEKTFTDVHIFLRNRPILTTLMTITIAPIALAGIAQLINSVFDYTISRNKQTINDLRQLRKDNKEINATQIKEREYFNSGINLYHSQIDRKITLNKKELTLMRNEADELEFIMTHGDAGKIALQIKEGLKEENLPKGLLWAIASQVKLNIGNLQTDAQIRKVVDALNKDSEIFKKDIKSGDRSAILKVAKHVAAAASAASAASAHTPTQDDIDQALVSLKSIANFGFSQEQQDALAAILAKPLNEVFPQQTVTHQERMEAGLLEAAKFASNPQEAANLVTPANLILALKPRALKTYELNEVVAKIYKFINPLNPSIPQGFTKAIKDADADRDTYFGLISDDGAKKIIAASEISITPVNDANGDLSVKSFFSTNLDEELDKPLECVTQLTAGKLSQESIEFIRRLVNNEDELNILINNRDFVDALRAGRSLNTQATPFNNIISASTVVQGANANQDISVDRLQEIARKINDARGEIIRLATTGCRALHNITPEEIAAVKANVDISLGRNTISKVDSLLKTPHLTIRGLGKAVAVVNEATSQRVGVLHTLGGRRTAMTTAIVTI